MERIPAHPVCVLVVDDYPLLRVGVQNLVNSRDDLEIVGEAADGERSCELAQLLQPDVVLMDIEIPKLNGIEATLWIKATLPHVIVIGLSIDKSSPVANYMRAAGDTAYLTIDTTPEDFYRVPFGTNSLR